jgi:integrase/recombinase XerD
MKHNPVGSMVLSKALVGFLNHKIAEGLSPRTTESYRIIIEKYIAYGGDRSVSSVTNQDVTKYLNWLRTEYVPNRVNHKTHPLTGKTIRNVWIAFSSFFTWASHEFQFQNPMGEVPPPKFPKPQVQEFSKEEIERLLKACVTSRVAKTKIRQSYTMHRYTANRDRAIILTLMDTGLRALELCSLKVGDVDLKTGKIDVRHGADGGAKGGKGRTVYLGKSTRNVVWRYLSEREDGEDPKAPLFTIHNHRILNPDSLRHLIIRIAEKAGVKDAHPHKFRHTFAITYLRSGGDIFTLQELLGHATLDMVRHYAHIAQVDVELAHRKASPVDNWRL